MRKLKVMIVLGLIVALTGFTSCKKDEPVQPHEASVQLSLEDVLCTEAWLKVSLTDGAEPRTVAIQQDGQRVLTVHLGSTDSLCVVEGLLPHRTYSFVGQLLRDSTAIDASTAVPATTMDTTTHNFTFHLDTLGVTSSTLSDVAIIDDTLAYAVGEIYLRDSTGQLDDTPYNLVKWDGARLGLKRIPFIGPCSAVNYPPLRAIWALSQGNILVTNGGSIVRYDGSSAVMDCRMNSLLTGAINKIYANNFGDIYVVGNSGTIVRYDGATWQRVQSGTTVTLNDVWGGSNWWVGQNGILIAAGNKYTAGKTQLLRISNTNEMDTISWLMQDRVINSIWFDGHNRVWVSGGGVFVNRGSGGWTEQPIPLIYTNRVRGNGQNDIWAVGDFGIAAHYNGLTWRDFREVRLDGNYESVAVKGNLMIAVGWIGNRAVILRGTDQ